MDKKQVLITGGTKGIGLAIAKALLPLSRRMLLTYNSDEASADQAVSTLQGSPGGDACEISTVALQMGHPESSRALHTTLQRLGWYPDVLVFNAGTTNRKSPWEITGDEWRKVFEVNVHFPTLLLQELVPHMAKGSVVLFTGSLMAIHPHSVSLAYGVSKSAVHALVHNLVKHLEPFGMRVAGIAPGFVDTEWQKNKPAEIRKNIEEKVAQHRFARPDEVGDVVRMLVTNDYFNGDIVTLSGGYAYRNHA